MGIGSGWVTLLMLFYSTWNGFKLKVRLYLELPEREREEKRGIKGMNILLMRVMEVIEFDGVFKSIFFSKGKKK